MQTFIPIATTEFHDIAIHLDNKRLNKQALEGWQILMNLLELDPQNQPRKTKGWSNHPAVKMWRGSEQALLLYILAMTDEWKLRGFKTTIAEKAENTMWYAVTTTPNKYGVLKYPDWMLDTAKFQEIAASHRKALLVKDYDWYSNCGWVEDKGYAPSTYEYVWPTQEVK
jgi:hypothetical protein